MEEEEHNKEASVEQEKANMLGEENMNHPEERVEAGVEEETRHDSQYAQLA